MTKRKGKKSYSKMASVRTELAPDHLRGGHKGKKKGRSKKSR